jgi:hypothetical protein
MLRRLGKKAAAQGMPTMAIIAHDTIGDYIILLGRYEADLLSAITNTIVPMALPEHRKLIALDVGPPTGNVNWASHLDQ